MKAISVELSDFVREVERFDVIAANSTTDDSNLVPRSSTVRRKEDLVNRFRACSVPARPEIRDFLSVRMFVLSVVIKHGFRENS